MSSVEEALEDIKKGKLVIVVDDEDRENDGDFTGASINTWQWVGGNGPFAELKGIIMTGAYLQLGKNVHDGGNFIWKGTASGISDKIIQAINSYTKKVEE